MFFMVIKSSAENNCSRPAIYKYCVRTSTKEIKEDAFGRKRNGIWLHGMCSSENNGTVVKMKRGEGGVMDAVLLWLWMEGESK